MFPIVKVNLICLQLVKNIRAEILIEIQNSFGDHVAFNSRLVFICSETCVENRNIIISLFVAANKEEKHNFESENSRFSRENRSLS
jgi:hypothetical protein